MAKALEGIRILDFTTAIAGSYAIRILADLGADVTKIESFEGDSFRSQIGNFIAWNTGKRGIVVDLKQDKGREIIYKLVKGADVVAHNFRPVNAKKLGVDYETLRAINPELVYSSESAWGDSGPYGGKPGFDPVLQAETGMMASQGYGQETPMDLSHAEVDVPTAALHAYAILAALYVREKTGKGQHIKALLMNGALAVQPGTFVFYDGKPEPVTAGKGYLGPNATVHFYKTQGEWIFIECEDERCWGKLCQALGKPELKSDERFISASKRRQNDGALTSILENTFRARSSTEWLEQLEATGVPCSPVNSYDSIPQQAQIVAEDLIGESSQPIMKGYLKQAKTFFKLSETPSDISRPAPLLGEHTEEVLNGLGYSTVEIKELKRLRVIP